MEQEGYGLFLPLGERALCNQSNFLDHFEVGLDDIKSSENFFHHLTFLINFGRFKAIPDHL
jgi:hypothetical protein